MKLHSRASSISDTETLIGSPSPSSLNSPNKAFFKFKKSSFDDLEKSHVISPSEERTSDFDNDMALKICMDLLTKELSTAFTKQGTLHSDQRASGLQVLLMIEAYETVQQHLRQKRYSSNLMAEEDNQVQDVERILEYWLQVLYSVYDRSHELSSKGNEEYFPLPLAVGGCKNQMDAMNYEDENCAGINWYSISQDNNFF